MADYFSVLLLRVDILISITGSRLNTHLGPDHLLRPID